MSPQARGSRFFNAKKSTIVVPNTALIAGGMILNDVHSENIFFDDRLMCCFGESFPEISKTNDADHPCI